MPYAYGNLPRLSLILPFPRLFKGLEKTVASTSDKKTVFVEFGDPYSTPQQLQGKFHDQADNVQK
jgi:hypothetical protein